jgi:MoaA/NifB/PqqE/SkfB family radical SAM enzyme
MELKIDNLVFEVTRRCNLRCDHCLRGGVQNVDLSYKIINTVLDDIDNVSSITFTGGEPFLNTKAICHTFTELHKRDMELGSFWLATNGKIYKKSFVSRLIKEYRLIKEKPYSEFYGGLAVSIDDYHGDTYKKNIDKFKKLPFYDNSKEIITKERKRYYSVINEGRASKNRLGIRNIRMNQKLDYEIDEDSIRIESSLYINALGDVLTECDYSYVTQKQAKIGNVLQESLKDIIFKHLKKQAPDNFYSTLVECEVEE